MSDSMGTSMHAPGAGGTASSGTVPTPASVPDTAPGVPSPAIRLLVVNAVVEGRYVDAVRLLVLNAVGLSPPFVVDWLRR